MVLDSQVQCWKTVPVQRVWSFLLWSGWQSTWRSYSSAPISWRSTRSVDERPRLISRDDVLSMPMSIAIFSVAQIVKLLQSPRQRVRWEQNVIIKYGEWFTQKKCLEPLTEKKANRRARLNVQWQGVPENGNERRPTVDRRNGGTWRPSDCDDDESSSECRSVQSLRCSFSSNVLFSDGWWNDEVSGWFSLAGELAVQSPSVLWHSWLDDMEGIWPAKTFATYHRRFPANPGSHGKWLINRRMCWHRRWSYCAQASITPVKTK